MTYSLLNLAAGAWPGGRRQTICGHYGSCE
jgi:hypothetical protein